MKKILSVILCAAMLLCLVPAAAFAEDSTHDFSAEDSTLDNAMYFTANAATQFNIPAGVTVTIPSGKTVYLPEEKSLCVQKDGKLVVNGSLYVQGRLEVVGTLSGASKVTVIEGVGDATVQITLNNPADYNWGPDGEKANIRVSYFTSKLDNLYGDAIAEKDWHEIDFSAGAFSKSFDLNDYLYIKAEIKEDNPVKDKYDDARLKVYFNEVEVPYTQGVHRTAVQTGSVVSYSYFTKDSDYYTMKKISLPTGEGYEVIGRDCEANAEGAVELKYGQPFSFRVEIDEAYDMSSYEVYIYNGYGWTNLDLSVMLNEMEPAKADEYGYYNIPSVEGDYTVQVIGVTKNETITLIGNILETLRNVFNMIKEFFESIFDLFK